MTQQLSSNLVYVPFMALQVVLAPTLENLIATRKVAWEQIPIPGSQMPPQLCSRAERFASSSRAIARKAPSMAASVLTSFHSAAGQTKTEERVYLP